MSRNRSDSGDPGRLLRVLMWAAHDYFTASYSVSVSGKSTHEATPMTHSDSSWQEGALMLIRREGNWRDLLDLHDYISKICHCNFLKIFLLNLIWKFRSTTYWPKYLPYSGTAVCVVTPARIGSHCRNSINELFMNLDWRMFEGVFVWDV